MSEKPNAPSAPHDPSSKEPIRDDRPDGSPEPADDSSTPDDSGVHSDTRAEPPKEYGGRKGPDPVRYGDWEKNGRCIDF